MLVLRAGYIKSVPEHYCIVFGKALKTWVVLSTIHVKSSHNLIHTASFLAQCSEQ